MTWTPTGERFGMLVVLGPVGQGRSLRWRCQCDCGATSVVQAGGLKSGRSTSCGCRRRRKVKAPAGSDVRLWRIWCNMRHRCALGDDEVQRNYSGRGISVCSERQDYDVFAAWAHAHGYAEHLSINRRDNDGITRRRTANGQPIKCRRGTRVAPSGSSITAARYA